MNKAVYIILTLIYLGLCHVCKDSRLIFFPLLVHHVIVIPIYLYSLDRNVRLSWLGLILGPIFSIFLCFLSPGEPDVKRIKTNVWKKIYRLIFRRKLVIVNSKEELRKLIITVIKEDGYDCNLNFIDTSNITDMSELFKDSDSDSVFKKFYGNIFSKVKRQQNYLQKSALDSGCRGSQQPRVNVNIEHRSRPVKMRSGGKSC